MAVGPFCVGTDFGPIWALLFGDVAVLGPAECRTLKRRYPALIMASSKGDKEWIQFLLDQGADINCTDNDGNTALHLAAKNGHGPCVALLLSAPGIDANPVNHKGQTPLMLTTDDEIKTMLQKRTT